MRILYQTLLAAARESVLITTPYFLPDRAESREMSYDEWRARPLRERAYEQLGRLLERQQ